MWKSSYKRDDWSTSSITSSDKKSNEKMELDAKNKVRFVNHLEKRTFFKNETIQNK